MVPVFLGLGSRGDRQTADQWTHTPPVMPAFRPSALPPIRGSRFGDVKETMEPGLEREGEKGWERA